MLTTTKTIPQLEASKCLNACSTKVSKQNCSQCHDVCPAQAIHFSDNHLPIIDEDTCTSCTACVSSCPTDALMLSEVDVLTLVQQAATCVKQHKTHIHATCSAAETESADLFVPCHAIWDPLLLAALAGEGIHTLNIDGLEQCATCPKQHGKIKMQQTEIDYATLNHALGVRLNLSYQAIPQEKTKTKTVELREPERRAFFRNLVPSLLQGAALAINQTNLQYKTDEIHEAISHDVSPRPVRLKLFLRALPQLQSNFLPVPIISSIPLGAIQATSDCTACESCVEVCPSQALNVKDFGANKILEFKADACLGCQICIHACPEKALQPLPTISLPAILSETARPLVMIPSSKIKNIAQMGK